jgi:deoxyribose-phosphate aldolase
MEKTRLQSAIEHTILKPTATAHDIEKLCREAREHQFFGVCVNTTWIPMAVQLLKGSSVKVVAVAGFPLGACVTAVKCFEVEYAVSQGADEIDFVVNLGWVKAQDYESVKKEFLALHKAAQQLPLKVILETSLLSKEEKQRICELAVECGIAFVKTSTGFSTGGATIEDIQLMRSVVQHHAGVKASGGIRDRTAALAFLDAGSDRLGTSSGIAIIS